MREAKIDLKDAKILIVDDTPANLKVLRQALEPEGYSILAASNGETAHKIARKAEPDLILLDVLMPGMDGFETCRLLKGDAATQGIPIIFITARAETDAVVEGFRAGGVDYIVKPFQNEEVLIRVETHLRIDRLARELVRKNAELGRTNRRLQEEIAQRKALRVERNHLSERLSMISRQEAERWGIAGFIGKSRTIRRIFKDIGLLQTAETTTALITGESGTGKELIARAIHYGGPRSSGPFVPVNCSTIPTNLAESLLFGHVRGAFTGADRDQTGYFELADGGTLFLDEIGDMPPDLQAKLLRVLEDGVVTSLGTTRGRPVDVRVLAATNADLKARIAAGTFRQDLYFRLARFPVSVSPIRERREDIPLLARHFLDIFASEMGVEPSPLNPEVLAALEAYDFPDNVRELKNLIERALIESHGDEIRPEHLHFVHITSGASDRPAPASGLNPEEVPLNLDEAEVFLIRHVLEQAGGNVAAAARILGTNRNRIYRILDRAEQREDG